MDPAKGIIFESQEFWKERQMIEGAKKGQLKRWQLNTTTITERIPVLKNSCAQENSCVQVAQRVLNKAISNRQTLKCTLFKLERNKGIDYLKYQEGRYLKHKRKNIFIQQIFLMKPYEQEVNGMIYLKQSRVKSLTEEVLPARLHSNLRG